MNALFGDDLFVMGVDAPTSFAVHRIEDPPGSGGVFINADSTFTIDNPQTGLVRVALQGDWTNAGRVSAELTIERERSLPTLPSRNRPHQAGRSDAVQRSRCPPA